jgi:hypothetical protein
MGGGEARSQERVAPCGVEYRVGGVGIGDGVGEGQKGEFVNGVMDR